MAFQVYPSQRQTAHLFFLKLGMALLAMDREGAPALHVAGEGSPAAGSTQTQLDPPGLFFVLLPGSTQPPPSPLNSHPLTMAGEPSPHFTLGLETSQLVPSAQFLCLFPQPSPVSPNLLAQKKNTSLQMS